MKIFLTPYIYSIALILFTALLFGQGKSLELVSESEDEQKVLNSISFKKLHDNDSLAYHEAARIKEALMQKGYLSLEWKAWKSKGSSCLAMFALGPRTEEMIIYLDSVPPEWSRLILKTASDHREKDHLLLPFEKFPSFIEDLTEKLHDNGHPFARVQLQQIELTQNKAQARLVMVQEQRRTIDKIVIRGYEDFPNSFITHALRLKIGSTYNRQKLDRASAAINSLDFAEEAKAPEVLFTGDSTIVYLYLRKKKANAFDGLIGFASEDQGDGLELNGYLDLQVKNLFNGGESLNLFWKSNGNERQRFFLETKLPYLFKTPLLPYARLEIYRQDSTFSNVTFNAGLGYAWSDRVSTSALFSTEKSDDLNASSGGISSYQNYFGGAGMAYRINYDDPLFLSAFELQIELGIGSRKITDQSTAQTKIRFNAAYLLPLGREHFLYFGNYSAALRSDDYLQNELFRIGGIKDLRGVNEESLIASLYTIINLEYRYKTSDQSYFFTITDGAYLENRSTLENTRIFSLGLGYSFQTKMGRISLSYANGKFEDSPFSLNDSKLHVKILNQF